MSVVSLNELSAKWSKEGWVADTILPELPLPVGIDRAELSDEVNIQGSWIANPAFPVKSVTLRKGVKAIVTVDGLSVEKGTQVVLPHRKDGDLNVKLFKTPVRYDRESKDFLGLTFRAPSFDKEIKLVLVERAIKIRIRDVEQLYFTGSTTVMVFEKKMAKEKD